MASTVPLGSKLFEAAWSSKGVRWITFGWLAFITENVVLSHNREEIICEIGDDNYHLIYGSLSTAACSSIAWGYIRHGRGMGPILPARGPVSITAGIILQALGLAGLSQIAPSLQIPIVADFGGNKPSSTSTSEPTAGTGTGSNTKAASSSGTSSVSGFSLTVRCPMDFRPRDKSGDGIHGLERVSRHSTFWSLGLFTLGRAATTVFVPEIVFHSFPVIFALIGGAHQDYRYRRGWGGSLSPEKDAVTSNVPFLALVTGKQSWSALRDEVKWTNAGLAALAAVPLTLRQIKRCRII